MNKQSASALLRDKDAKFYEGLEQGKIKAPLTDSQLGIYLACMLMPKSKMYNVPLRCVYELNEPLSGEEIKARVDAVIKKHPALYAHIVEESGTLYMVRGEFPEAGICEYREGELSEAELNELVLNYSRLIDINAGPFCRALACWCSGKLQLILELHHMMTDGGSGRLLFRQLADSLSGKPVPDEEVDAFSLFEAEKRIFESPEHEAAEKYYEALLGGVETDSSLIPDYAETEDEVRYSRLYCMPFDTPADMDSLNGTGITKNTLFMAAFGYALAKMTGQENSLFTAAESGRNCRSVLNTQAMMVRTLPIVMHLDENEAGLPLLKSLQTQFYESIRHDSMSFPEMNKKYGVTSEVSFVYQSDMFVPYQSGSITGTFHIHDTGHASAKLNFMVFKELEGFSLRIEYRTDLYSVETIRRLAELFLKSVDVMLSGAPLKDAELISDSDKALIKSFNDASVLDYDTSKTFVDIFRDVAKKYPEKTAVVYRDRSYTYAQVDALSDSIAAYILSLGIGRGQTVSVLIPRCEYMVIASIGVIKAGAVYEPMDPAYPCERLTFMHTDADTQLLIADRDMVSLLPEYKGAVLYTDEIPALPKAKPEELIFCAPEAEDGYVLLYTSGTTGKPKGCLLCHRNLSAFIASHTETLKLSESSRMSFYPSYGFDAHMADLYPAMANGCTLYVIPDEMRLDFPVLKDYFEKNKITHSVMTTQVARQFLLEYSFVEHLEVLSMGGEALLSYEPKNNYRVANLYGPTECTVCVTGFYVTEYRNPIPIGKPLPNSRIFVVDSFGRPVPVGVPGELIICGPQVGKGYINRPEKTAEVFVPNTFEENPDAAHMNCYKTGDIVRWLPEGNLVFIGRRDLQVKIRGYRIELSEVEQVIRSYEGIKDAAVIAVDCEGGKCIHAYIVADSPVDIKSLNEYIGSKKPAYMIPAGTMQIEKIPLTVNQKLDKRALPPITAAASTESRSGARSLTLIEEQLLAILRDVAGDVSADVDTEFAYAGVTSISSIKLASRIYKQFGLHITSKDILGGGSILSVENAIIRQLLEGANKEDEPAQKPMLSSYPLTQTQMGIYLDSLRAGMAAYNIPLLYKLPEGIDTEKLKAAIRRAIANHPSMLVHIYADEKGEPALYPVPDMAYEIDELSLPEPVPQLTEFAFDKAPLFHVSILSCGADKYLLLELHHIIGDGESMAILTEDIDRAYRGEALEGEEMSAFELSLSEQSARNGEELNKARAAYDSIFRGVSTDYVPYADLKGDAVHAVAENPIACKGTAIREKCLRCGVTENTLFTAAFALTIARFTCHEDALFATIYNGRTDPRTQRLVSMLVKTLPVYVQAEGKTKVLDYLKGVEAQLSTLRQNDIFSFADAAKEYGVGADVMFIYQGRILSDAQLDGKALEAVPVKVESPKAALTAEVFEDELGFGLTLEYNAGSYSEAWVEGFADAYVTCLESLLTADTLADASITSEAALHRFDSFNDTDIAVEYLPVHKRISAQARINPDKIALISSPEDSSRFADSHGRRIYEKLSYSQLDNMTSELAGRLLALGIKSGDAVGVMTGRSKEVYIGELGIMKAGCPFVFLSPSYPQERVSYICTEADIKAIVTTYAVADAHRALFEELNIPAVFADDIDTEVSSPCHEIEVSPESLAYMIYTSGTTGQPKGVMITHGGLNNLSDNNEKNLQMKYLLTDTMCAVSAFTFDASIIDGIASLANGVTLCIAAEEDIHNPVEFCRLCLDNGVKSFVGTPSFAISLLDCPDIEKVVEQLHALCCGGEVFPPMLYDKLKSINPELRLINGYGPSETTVCCSVRLLESSKNIDIGTPINNTKIHIIDKQNRILPMGALGELAITGAGVGLGYLNRPDLTAKSFFTLNGVPAYKSGDLALITNDGRIEFHGRIDNQVKLRGLRVELGEIESVINACEGVKNSIVLVKGKGNSQHLVAYYTAEREIAPEEIKAEAAKKLTEYMVPQVLMQLNEMPMTANGKIDKKALPEPEVSVSKNEYVAPSTPVEEALCRVFAEALSVERVGVTDDFFELGGTSLTATKIAMYAMANDIRIAYKDVFVNPTVRALALLAGGTASDADVSSEKEEDFTEINRVLEKNVWQIGDDAGYRPLGNILLTGATGFLGMHILKSFLDSSEGVAYCLLKKGYFESVEKRLSGVFFYYFGESPDALFGSRICCIDGDITDMDGLLSLRDVPFDTVINCAACVKHFANDDILERVNVKGVENLTELCMEKKARLIHISTISVAGESVDGTPDKNIKLTECSLYFGQQLENKYIRSKFDSEKVVLSAAARGLDGKIMRLGNLMPRYCDGEFQINFLTNGFMRQLRGYRAVGCAPYSALSGELEFSPIDDTAAAILALAQTDSRFTVFHVNNNHKVFMSDIFRAMNGVGLKVDCVSEAEFAQKLKAAVANTEGGDEAAGLIAYLNSDVGVERYMLGYDNGFTANVLNRIGWSWNITDIDYLKNAFTKLKGLRFFGGRR